MALSEGIQDSKGCILNTPVSLEKYTVQGNIETITAELFIDPSQVRPRGMKTRWQDRTESGGGRTGKLKEPFHFLSWMLHLTPGIAFEALASMIVEFITNWYKGTISRFVKTGFEGGHLTCCSSPS